MTTIISSSFDKLLFERAALLIEKAKSFTDLLSKGEDILGVYRRLARICHPDFAPPEYTSRATKIFSLLSALYTEHTKGDPKSSSVVIGPYVIGGPLAKGDLCDVYLAENCNGEVVFKIAQRERDNDLLVQEKNALQQIYKLEDKFNGIKFYFLPPLKSFRASGRQVNIFSYDKRYITLSDILIHYNRGLDFKHIVWMGNRLFNAIGYMRAGGIVHGAIFPENVLYSPSDHGMRLIDFCYSTNEGKPLSAIITKYSSLYPPEIMRKNSVSTATDIYLAAQMLKSASDRIPPQFDALFAWCMAESPNSRPCDAWDFADRWKATAKVVYGEPKFIPLVVATS
jgi:serine/threonine protein kinase